MPLFDAGKANAIVCIPINAVVCLLFRGKADNSLSSSLSGQPDARRDNLPLCWALGCSTNHLPPPEACHRVRTHVFDIDIIHSAAHRASDDYHMPLSSAAVLNPPRLDHNLEHALMPNISRRQRKAINRQIVKTRKIPSAGAPDNKDAKEEGYGSCLTP